MKHSLFYGLRGVAFRTGGPGDVEAYMGMRNEGMSCYEDGCSYTPKEPLGSPTLVTGRNQDMLDNIASATSGMKAYLASISRPVNARRTSRSEWPTRRRWHPVGASRSRSP